MAGRQRARERVREGGGRIEESGERVEQCTRGSLRSAILGRGCAILGSSAPAAASGGGGGVGRRDREAHLCRIREGVPY
eukprot:1450300-Prymnesium_polylepis.1